MDTVNELAAKYQPQAVVYVPDQLEFWFAAISKARAPHAVFSLMNEFRARTWTDQQRAEMSRHYIRHLALIERLQEYSECST